ncbi:MAG: hypothetical protein GY874_18165 [Desulfobacteraceae bacterium]|nr:hypothetical protein [Desulfobacteraceae bacterium]
MPSTSTSTPSKKRKTDSSTLSPRDKDQVSRFLDRVAQAADTPNEARSKNLGKFKQDTAKSYPPILAAKTFFAEACCMLLPDLNEDQSKLEGDKFSNLLRSLRKAQAKVEKLQVESEANAPRPLRIKPFISCSSELTETKEFKDILRTELLLQGKYKSDMSKLLLQVGEMECKAATHKLLDFLTSLTRKLTSYVYLTRYKEEYEASPDDPEYDAIALCAFTRAISIIKDQATTIQYKRYWFGLNLQDIKSKYTIDSGRYVEVCNELDVTSTRATITKTVESLIGKIIVGSIDTEILAKSFLEKKEEIKLIFAEAAADEAAQETIIELDKDGPTSVSQQTISKAQIATLTKAIKRDLLSDGYTLVKEDGGASMTSASEKKKKRLSKKKKAEKLERAAKAAKAKAKAARAKAKAKAKKNSSSNSTITSNSSSKRNSYSQSKSSGTDDSVSVGSGRSSQSSSKKTVSWK